MLFKSGDKMNGYHKRLVENKHRLCDQEAVNICNKAINDYAAGYDVADREGNGESRSYFGWRIKQVCQLLDEILH